MSDDDDTLMLGLDSQFDSKPCDINMGAMMSLDEQLDDLGGLDFSAPVSNFGSKKTQDS